MYLASRINFKVMAAFLLIFLTSVAFGQTYTEATAGYTSKPVTQLPQAILGGLTFYTNQATFEADAPDLPSDDFSGSLLPPNSVCSNPPLLNSATNDACFAPGGVIPDFDLDVRVNGGGADYVILTNTFLGVVGNVVGPNSFPDDLILNFNPPVNAAGMDIIGELIAPVAVNITVFDAGGNSLGTTSANGANPGLFWGVISDTPIGRIEMVEPSGNGELITNLQFGDVVPSCTVTALNVDSDGNVTLNGICPEGVCAEIWVSENCDLTVVNAGNATFLGCVGVGTTSFPFQEDSCYYAADASGNVLAMATRTVPTLGNWAMIVFVLLLMGVALVIMRKRRVTA